MLKDSQGRKFLITINNHIVKGYDIDKQRSIMNNDNFKSLVYGCSSEEVGGKEGTHHLHIFLMFSSPVRFSTLKKHFPEAHIDRCKGTAKQNRDYVFKEGKHATKDTTNLKETHYETSELPLESNEKEADLERAYEMIKNGHTITEILEDLPHLFPLADNMERIRQKLLYDENKERLRPVFTIYIHGKTGTGKTRFVFQKHSLSETYKVSDYTHPFDRYNSEKILFLDEFRSYVKAGLFLQVLDLYPLTLPARYSQKQACYDVVYITSNEPFSYQFPDIQLSLPETYNAIKRRIHLVVNFDEYVLKYPNFEERYFALSQYIDRKHSEHLGQFHKDQDESHNRLEQIKEDYRNSHSKTTQDSSLCKPLPSIEEAIIMASQPKKEEPTNEVT